MQATLEYESEPLEFERGTPIMEKRPHPKQRLAIWLLGFDPYHPPPPVIVNEMVFGGAGGGSKSQLLRFLMMLIAQQWPGSKVAVFRKAGPDLDMTQILPFLSELPAEMGQFNWHHHIYRWANGSVTEFHACYEADDHLRFKSFEWDAVFFDESTEFPSYQLTFLRSRCRSTKAGWRPVIVYATNPGGSSHLWHKRLFVDGHATGVPFWGPWEATEAGIALIGGKDFRYCRCYLQSKLEDNPSLTPEMALAAMAGIEDPELRRAVAEGDWNLHAGQFFSEFRPQLHVVTPFSVPNDWPCWRSIDWGYAAPAAALWYARNPATMQTYIYREWVQAGVPSTEQAMRIKILSYGDPPIRLTLADPSMWRKTKGVGTSEAEEYKAGGVPLTRANNNRQMGWARLHKALTPPPEAYGPGLPTRAVELQIFETCPELINQIANVERSRVNPEDIKEPTNLTDKPRDDLLDSCRYGLYGATVASQQRNQQKTWGFQEENPRRETTAERRRRR